MGLMTHFFIPAVKIANFFLLGTAKLLWWDYFLDVRLRIIQAAE
jgi:hypothetical protein